MLAAHPGNMASMGAAMPYAIAAKLAHPDRPVIALVGDGAMQMNGINELITVARRWRSFKDPRFIVLVLNNGDLNMVTWEQRVTEGNPKFSASQDLPSFPYAQYAELLGLRGLRMDHPDRVGAIWQAALAADRPVVVEAVTDPNIPPLPPSVKKEQALAYTQALLKGDPDAARIVRASVKELFA
jgi:pyruvate dehydrogenase (quinone)